MMWLVLHGYKILSWRYKTKVGEIDLIVRRGGLVAFVEVKQRPSEAEALESVTPQMRRRIGQAAKQFIASHPRHRQCDQRFDVMAVSGFSVRHLDNAWMDTPYWS